MKLITWRDRLRYQFDKSMAAGPIALIGWLAVISLVVILRRKTGIQLTKADFKPQKSPMKQMLSIGIPVALQDGFIQVSFMTITVIANQRRLVWHSPPVI